MGSDIDINTIRGLSLRVNAYKYASEMLGDSPCKACDKFNTPDGLLDISRYSEFAECVDNLSCNDAKEYYKKYNKLKKRRYNLLYNKSV